MKTSFNFRSVVFKRAYRIIAETGCTLSAALTEAWRRYRNFKNETVSRLVRRIKGFDQYYYMSDDHRVYVKWGNIKADIREEMRSLPGFFITAIASQFKDREYVEEFL